ncbi:MAG: NifB/NifX family molybdenum-iron cluster-binding protein [Thermodesulfobacteriota bacterium]|nr:NifB/NifX family molybdenum-iron cluster-binding protein [Thermodesulfobacteriota bacterium]
MKIAFTTAGSDLDASLDSRFGRAPRFLIYDLESESFETVDNRRSMDSARGAGIQSAETVARLRVESIVTKHCGPKAFRVLSAAGIRVFTTDEATVAEALAKFRSGQLIEARSADVEGYWA